MPRTPADRRWVLALALPVGFGAGLRLWNLPAQVLVGDERWDVTAAVDLPVTQLLTNLVVGESNLCPPLAAWIRLLMDAGAMPDESLLRLPSFLFGIAALVLLPVLVRRVVGDRAAWLFAWLLALSPFLVFYSRMVRFYMPMLLVSTVCWLAFYRVRTHGGRGAGVLYASAAGFAVYLHPLAAPFVLAPLLFAAIDLARRRDLRWRTLRPLVELCAATGLALMLVVVPLWDSLWWLVSQKGGGRGPDAAALAGAAMRLAGTASPPVAIAFHLAAARGLFVLARGRPDFAALTAFIGVCGVASIAILAPVGAEGPILLSRYVLTVLPILTLWAAVGLAAPIRTHNAARAAQAIAVAIFGVLLVGSGPLGHGEFYFSSFAHRVIHEHWSLEPRQPPELESEHFYASLRDPARAGPIIEIPYQVVLYSETAAAHQRLHRQPVRVAGSLDPWWDDPRLGLRVHLSASPAALLSSDARHLVLHPRASAEEFRIVGRDPAYRRKTMRAYNFSRNVDFSSRELADRLAHAWGPPEYEDAWIVAWDLDAVRERTHAEPPSGARETGPS